MDTEALPGPTGCRGEILLIDDSPTSLQLLSTLLTDSGYRVREATNGELALWTVKAKTPDLILLDLRMPDTDGFAVCRQLKAMSQTASVPVIFLSAQDETCDKVLGLQVGAVDFIAKSSAHEEILARIDTHMTLARVKKALELERALLELRVEERTAQLARDMAERLKMEEEKRTLEKQLWQAKKMEAIGQLAGGIAHDFNNLLSLILGFAQFASNALATGKHEKLGNYLAEITKAGTAGQEVVAQLLAFSRVDEVTSQEVDIGPLVREAAESLRPTLGDDIVLGVEMPPADDGPPLRALIKPVQVTQIVTNLLLNARDAVRERGPGGRIAVTCRPAAADGRLKCASCQQEFGNGYICLSIRDNGIGIAPELAEKIFDPFFTTKDVGKGSGLGLPMVHGIVHSAGGHIALTSSADGGTCFSIYLPAAPASGH